MKGEICMKTYTRRIVSWVAALTLLVTCAISGLVLPMVAEGENIFVNGDFESGATAEWQSNSTYILSNVGKGGGYGYYQNRTQTDEWTATGQVRYKSGLLSKMKADTEYVLSFDYKTSGSALGQFYFDVPFGTTSDSKNLNAGFDLPKNVSDWATQTFRFTTPETLAPSTGWEFSIRARGGAGEVWYDNFVLTEAGVLEPEVTGTPTTEGSLYVHEFENGNGGFKYGSSAATVETEAGGNHALVMDTKGTMLLGTTTAKVATGKQYLVRFRYKNVGGVKVRLMDAFYSKADGGYLSGYFDIAATETEWTWYQFAHISERDVNNIDVALYMENSASTAAGAKVLIDNIEVIEVNNNTNLMPGGDMNGKSHWLKTYHSQGGVVEEDTIEAGNKVMHLPAGKSDIWLLMGGCQKNKLYEVSFRYRGGAIKHWWSSTNSALYQNIGSTAASDTWTEYKAYVKTISSSTGNYFMLRTDSANGEKDVWLDDMVVREVSIAADATATVEAGKTTTLTVTAAPQGAIVPNLTWASDNEAVATVVNGVVTGVAAGTANITATAGPLSVTCAVTVTAASGGGEPDPTPNENVLYEDNFENGAQGLFAGATTTNWSVTDGGVDGGKALSIGYKVADRWLKWNTLTFEANTRYSITFMAKGPEVRFSCYKYAGSYTLLGDSNIYTVPYQDGWTQYRHEFITGPNGFGNDPANSNYGLFFTRRSDLADTAEVTLIDNFKIEKIDENGERVLGGDFTYPGMQQWNGSHLKNSATFSVVDDPADATNKVLKIAAASDKLGDKYLQNLYLEPGRTYELTLKAKGAPVSFYLHPNSVSGNMASTWINTDETADWKTYTYTFTAGNDVRTNNDWVINITRNMESATDSYIDDFSIKTTEIPSASAITLNKTELKLGVGVNETLTFTTTPEGAKYDSVAWASNDTTVATVANGVVTGVKSGSAVITATVMVGDTPLTASCTVNVVVKATAFNIAQDEIYLSTSVNSDRCWVYEEIDLTTTPADADISGLTWSSNNESVATVEDGMVKAHAAGTATITVTNGEVSDTVTVKVDDQGERISGGDFEGNDWNNVYWTQYIIKSGAGTLEADPDNADNTVLAIPGNTGSAKWMWPAHVSGNRTYKLTFKAKNADGQAVLYVTPDYASNGGGWLYKTIATEGWTEVTYIISTVAPADLNRNYLFGFGNQKSSTLYIDDVSMVELPVATGLSIDDIEVPVKGTAAMSVTTTPAEASLGSLTWTSSDPSIISVDASGKLKAVGGSGSVTITVTNGTVTDTAKATITGEPATAIKLSKTKVYLKKNGEETLTVNTVPAVATYAPIEWSSSDTTIATVDATGKVTVTDKLGTAVITAKSGELTASCTVEVMAEAESFVLKDETIKLAPGVKSLKVKKTLDLVTTPANSFVEGISWASSNNEVATVDENGVVTAVAEGTATITVSKNGTPVDTCEVVVVWNGERITGGDFEDSDWDTVQWTNSIVKTGKGSVVTDPSDETNTVLALPNDNAKLDALWIANLHVNAGKAYKITFKVKGDGVTESQQLAAYFHGTSTSLNGWKYTSLTGEWKEVTYVFSTNALDDGTAAALNRNYCFGIDNNKQGTIYLDDFSLIELPDATALELGDEVKLWPTGSVTLAVQTVPAEASAGKLTWTSSDPSVIAVDQNGRVTAVADKGEVTITVTNGTLTDTVKVVIDEYANLLENGDFEQGDLNWPSHATIQAGVGKDGSYGMLLYNTKDGEKQDFFFKGTLALDPATTYVVEWDYFATTDAEFRLWAGNIGMSLYASSGNGTEWKHGRSVFTTPTNMVDINNAKYKGWIFSVTSDVEGTSPAIVDNITLKLYSSGVKAESIKLTKDKLTMMPGRTENLGIMATPADGDVNKSMWTSSNENVATVEYGIVTAVGKGTATITATTRGGVSASCEVTVSGNPAFITNGTFEDAGDNSWGMTGGTAIQSGVGVQSSKAGAIAADGALTYEIKNLEPKTTYQFFIRYRSAASGKLQMALKNGEEDLLGKTADTGASWVKQTYEFTTGETVADSYTLTLSATSGAPIFVDNIMLTQKATLIDFVVDSLVWSGGNEQVTPGTELTFYVFIRNIGKDPVKAGSTIDLDICMDSKMIQRVSYTFETEFAAGAMIETPIASKPWAAVKGDHVISVRVNSTLSVLESDTENNNMVQTDLRVYDELLKVPELAQEAGFTTLEFSDEFNSLDTVDMGATGADGYKWYVTRPYGSTSLTTEDYSMENGILTMKNVIPTYNMGFSSADCKTGRGYAFNKGYLEYRLRIPRPRENTEGEKGVPAVWSLPLDKLMSVPGSDWVEMDWMEYWGITQSRPGGYYTITMHDQGTNEKDEQTWYNKNTNYSKQGLGDGEWHVMSFLWVQDLLLGYMDGEEVFRITYNENSFSDPMQSVIVPDERGGIGAFSYMNVQELVLHLGGSKDNPMEMDYIRVWNSVGGGEYTPPAVDDGNGDISDDDIIFDMPAKDFWENYCTDDWGDPIVEITEENYEYILMGGEWWNFLSDERKAEINALLKAEGQPSFEELLAAATAFANGGGSPETGVATAAPAVATAMILSAAGLWISRKRKK